MQRSLRHAIRDLVKSGQDLAADSPAAVVPFPAINLKKEALKIKPSTLIAISKTGYNMVEQYNVPTKPARKFYEEESKLYDLIKLIGALGHDYCDEDYYEANYGPQYRREIAMCNAFVIRTDKQGTPAALTEICNFLDELGDRGFIHSVLGSVFIMPLESVSFVGIYVHVKSEHQSTIDKEFGMYKVEEGAEPRTLGEISDLRKNKS